MLVLFRRHLKNCEHYQDGRKWRRCRCPISVEGSVAGEKIRKALDMTSWEAAQQWARDKEASGTLHTPSAVTLAEAVAKFYEDAPARNLKPATVKKYKVVLSQLTTFAADKSVVFLKQISVSFVRDFRASWKDSPISGVKKLERVRAFFGWCGRSGWMKSNPATSVDTPVVDGVPTLPFDVKEVTAALARAKEPRWHALILVLRWSGLRIGDAMKLGPDKLNGNRLFLRTAKTGTHVFVPLPPFVIDEVKTLPLYGGFWFWNRAGESKLDTATGNARRSLRKIFEAAGIKGGHPHRFRDTFAVALLAKGVPIETVATLLGHSDVRVTQRSYAPHVKLLQDNLEKAVASTWDKPKLVRVK